MRSLCCESLCSVPVYTAQTSHLPLAFEQAVQQSNVSLKRFVFNIQSPTDKYPLVNVRLISRHHYIGRYYCIRQYSDTLQPLMVRDSEGPITFGLRAPVRSDASPRQPASDTASGVACLMRASRGQSADRGVRRWPGRR